MNVDIKKRFFENRDETGRYVIVSNVTGVNYYVEPIHTGKGPEWGSYNPASGKVEFKKGAGKYTGAITKEETLITTENGFKNIATLPKGCSPNKEIELRDVIHERNGVRVNHLS